MNRNVFFFPPVVNIKQIFYGMLTIYCIVAIGEIAALQVYAW
jgi:hypothetical protein